MLKWPDLVVLLAVVLIVLLSVLLRDKDLNPAREDESENKAAGAQQTLERAARLMGALKFDGVVAKGQVPGGWRTLTEQVGAGPINLVMEWTSPDTVRINQIYTLTAGSPPPSEQTVPLMDPTFRISLDGRRAWAPKLTDAMVKVYPAARRSNEFAVVGTWDSARVFMKAQGKGARLKEIVDSPQHLTDPIPFHTVNLKPERPEYNLEIVARGGIGLAADQDQHVAWQTLAPFARPDQRVPSIEPGKQAVLADLIRTTGSHVNQFECVLEWMLQSRAVQPKLKILHLSCHKGCRSNLNLVLASKLDHQVDHLNFLDEGNSIYNMTAERADQVWQKYKDTFMHYDHIIVSDTSPLSRAILQHMDQWTGLLVIWVCNRFDYADRASLSRGETFPDEGYYQLIEEATLASNRVRMVNYCHLERVYALHKGRWWRNPEASLVVRPAGYDSSFWDPANNSIPASVDMANTLFVPPYTNDTECLPLEELKRIGIQVWRGRYNGPNELKGFKGILHVPYAPSNLALFESWQNGVVYFLPSVDFWFELTEKTGHWISGSAAHLEVSEWYRQENRDCFIYFDSWAELAELVKDRRLIEQVRGRVLARFKTILAETLAAWRFVLRPVLPPIGQCEAAETT